jgi:hypothetical protein
VRPLKKNKRLLIVVLFSTIALFGARTIVDLTRDVSGILPLANGGTGGSSYVKGEFHTFCTGTVASSATTNFIFPGFGSNAIACGTALTSATGGTKISTAGTIKNLFVNMAVAGKSGDNIKLLKNGSATGAPTCTYGATTTCNDVATAITVAQGDVITISNSGSVSETAANISVSFELWN